LKLPVNYVVSICFLLGISLSTAQNKNQEGHLVKINLPDITLINIVSSTNNVILLQGDMVNEAGKSVSFNKSDKSIWINYTSIIGSETTPNRNVTVEISDGKVPDGLVLAIKVNEDIGLGNGNMGKPVDNKQELTNNPIIIITEIESSNTGVGANKGYNVEYTLNLKQDSSYASLDFDQAIKLSIVYTLSDN
jgi:hypothetical protein